MDPKISAPQSTKCAGNKISKKFNLSIVLKGKDKHSHNNHSRGARPEVLSTSR